MVGFDGSFISCVIAVELGRRCALAGAPGMMPSSVSAVPLGGCDPPLGATMLAEEAELPCPVLMLDGCELLLDGCELRLDGTGWTPGRGGRELRDLAGAAIPPPSDGGPAADSLPGAKSPRNR